MTPKKEETKALKQLLDDVCFELGLDYRQDKHVRDYIVTKNGLYLFRVVFNTKHKFFGVRFATVQSSDFTYNKEKIRLLVDSIVGERKFRKVSNGSDYSKEKHIK